MSNFIHYLQGKGLSAATAQAYHYYLLDFISWTDRDHIDPVSLTKGDVMAYLNELKQRDMANSSRNNRLIALRHYFDWQLHQQDRTDNLVQLIRLRGIKTRKMYPPLNTQELEQIYHQYDPAVTAVYKVHLLPVQQLSRQRNKVMLGLVIYQGLFTSEINLLKVKDLKLKEGKVYVSGTRSSNERELELKPQQVIDLMEYCYTTRKALLEYGNGQRELLFLPAPSAGKSKATDHDTAHVWKRLTREVKACQPRVVNMLHLRTSVITCWLQHYNLRQVQYMAGHRYASTTEGYRANQVEDLLQDIDRFHPMG